MASGSFTLDTPHGLISVTDTARKNDNPALLLIHGNSSSSKIWKNIQSSRPIAARCRIVAFDLPGHGASSNAPEPEKSYSMRGYAELATYILEHLNIKSVIVLGWSLGGHVGIEMIPLLAEREIAFKGLMLTGTPPCLGLEQMDRGFSLADLHMSFAGKRDWPDEVASEFARMAAGEPFEQWMEDDAKRTDGRARELMLGKLAKGVGIDQRKVVEENEEVLIAVVDGAVDPFINLNYVEKIKWKNLWKGKCFRIPGLKHAPFWERPDVYHEYLANFLIDCQGSKSTAEIFTER